ncbi:MAG: alcohol dehydrogenase catalytic domain-containing protein, partial [Firmicutes bacterium]|nr:alcohol dehydrogenase catalytic domain-containing protein [Bacillota bacterium]
MKALVLHNISDIRYEDVDIPRTKENEVLVKVKAVGICGSDIPRVYKTGAYHYPLIVGHEFSGEVVEVGSIENNRWLNKRVGVFPLIPCGKCGSCKNEKYELCRNYDYIGSRRNGGFAEYVAVPVSNLLELPENVSFEEAAMLEPMCVAIHAIRRVSIKQTDTVAVCGLGTIGMFILMYLRDIGIENVYAIGNKDIQREKALSFGISVDNFCDSRKCDIAEFIKEKTNGRG